MMFIYLVVDHIDNGSQTGTKSNTTTWLSN
jgi:hypothetical protein